MIHINSAVKLSFMFPADRYTAYAYYSSMERLVSHLKHITVVRSDPVKQEYRMYYNTVELGAYHIHVYCDVRMELENGQELICLVSTENEPPIETAVTFTSTTTRGYYSSEARFFEIDDDQTRIEYTLRMKATPPRPMGLKFMPTRVVDAIAQNITTNRVREIAENFIASSLESFPLWLAQTD